MSADVIRGPTSAISKSVSWVHLGIIQGSQRHWVSTERPLLCKSLQHPAPGSQQQEQTEASSVFLPRGDLFMEKQEGLPWMTTDDSLVTDTNHKE